MKRHPLQDEAKRCHTFTRMIGCLFKATAHLRAEGWTLEGTKSGHNHGSTSVMAHSIHRKKALTTAVSSYTENES